MLAAAWWTPADAAQAIRAPVVWALAALALLSSLSSVWTIGPPSQAVRDGGAVLALAGVVVAAATLRPPWVHAGLLLAAGLGVAIVGLVAAIVMSEPLALNICGTWRPAGPFEYPPAVGLVCAGALPVAVALGAVGHARMGLAGTALTRLYALGPVGRASAAAVSGVPPRLLAFGTRGRAGVAVAGALCAWLLAVSVALTANRTAVALAGGSLVAAVWLAPRRLELGPLALAVIASAAASALVVGTHLGDAGAGRLLAASAFAALPCVVAAARPLAAARRGGWIAVVAVAAVAATGASVAADRGSGCQGDASHGRVGIWRAAVATASHRPLQGYGSGTFLQASRKEQLERRPRPTRFAHNLPLEAWVELGVLGLAFVLAWYAAVGELLVRAVRRNGSAYLLVPMVAAFPLANLLDWPWHLLGAGVVWAVAAGGLVAASASSGRR